MSKATVGRKRQVAILDVSRETWRELATALELGDVDAWYEHDGRPVMVLDGTIGLMCSRGIDELQTRVVHVKKHKGER